MSRLPPLRPVSGVCLAFLLAVATLAAAPPTKPAATPVAAQIEAFLAGHQRPPAS